MGPLLLRCRYGAVGVFSVRLPQPPDSILRLWLRDRKEEVCGSRRARCTDALQCAACRLAVG